MNDLFQVDDRQVTNYNKDISLKDLQGNSMVVCKCYCTITTNESISYHMSVENAEVFNAYKDTIMVQIEEFKKHAEQIATENNVPII